MSASDRLRQLHATGCFVILNAWDAGSARLFAAIGAPALATTSSGFAATLGRADQRIRRDELIAHVDALTHAVAVPLSVDAEDGYAPDPDGVGVTVRALAEAGAAGVSIEDWDAGATRMRTVAEASDRIRAAVEAAGPEGPVIIARCENALYDTGGLDDTLARLEAYRDTGAEMLYAPGLTEVGALDAVVGLGAPVNALLLPGGPDVAVLARLGVRRVSVGGALAWTAYGAAVDAARACSRRGDAAPRGRLDPELRAAAFGQISPA